MDLSPRLSYIRLRNAQHIESVELMLDDGRYEIPNRGKGIFIRDFRPPPRFPPENLSLSVGSRESIFDLSYRTVSDSISVSSIEILSKFRGQGLHKKSGKVTITLGDLDVTLGVILQTEPLGELRTTTPSVFQNPRARQLTLRVAAPRVPANPVASQSIAQQPIVARSTSVDTVRSAGIPIPANMPLPANRDGLRPTTEELIKQLPRFRVLVTGKSGVGKSTLINRIFGVDTASVSKDIPGQADIEMEFTSPENDRLILHDSKGFEAGDARNYESVKSFIVKRKKEPKIKDQLHAVWLCVQIPIPTHGERLLENALEAFLKIRKEVLGNTPTIVVFTKRDRLVSFMRQRKPGDPEAERRFLQEECVQLIEDFTGENIAHVAVSSKPRYEHELRDLITLTQDMVSMSLTSPENQVSPVPLAPGGAQRMLPTLKVNLSIAVGKQRYWRLLGASANFPGYTMQDCLCVIHTDIVAVWNFYDPCRHLYSEEFRNLMMNMVEKVDAPTESNLNLSGSGTLSASDAPSMALAPVVLPSTTHSLGKWVYASYQQPQGVPTKFMAYIVDLTHVLEILFSLTAGMRAKKTTRTAIKLAYQAYNGSEWMTHTHVDIRSFRYPSTAGDPVLDKITSMIPSDDREVRVSRALETIPRVDLERDEEWTSEGV
ncbi:hypothetical protein BKA82DRAFT_1000494 [Pisolithus tinctorius]|uniref:G domain-containing protein n=1 Tax=Pisolithus tinctorius Marx 270 TaxID=870435 RepID=A0A0C3P9X2_PISTI|nr:hypothetical protein BKA82DRAFT_1000494 [Pisolithus tinctorius]KIO04676.1 hypothetical protein M404DRAFT_1000494 [Pisolithus tinctorius Marx 270]